MNKYTVRVDYAFEPDLHIVASEYLISQGMIYFLDNTIDPAKPKVVSLIPVSRIIYITTERT